MRLSFTKLLEVAVIFAAIFSLVQSTAISSSSDIVKREGHNSFNLVDSQLERSPLLQPRPSTATSSLPERGKRSGEKLQRRQDLDDCEIFCLDEGNCGCIFTVTYTRTRTTSVYESETTTLTSWRTETDLQTEYITITETANTQWVSATVTRTTTIITPTATAAVRPRTVGAEGGDVRLEPRQLLLTSILTSTKFDTVSTTMTTTKTDVEISTTTRRATTTIRDTFVAGYNVVATSTSYVTATVFAAESSGSEGLTDAQRTGAIAGGAAGGATLLVSAAVLLFILRARRKKAAAVDGAAWDDADGTRPGSNEVEEYGSPDGDPKGGFFFGFTKRKLNPPTQPRTENSLTPPTAVPLLPINNTHRSPTTNEQIPQRAKPPNIPSIRLMPTAANIHSTPPVLSPISPFTPISTINPRSSTLPTPVATTTPFQIKRKAVPDFHVSPPETGSVPRSGIESSGISNSGVRKPQISGGAGRYSKGYQGSWRSYSDLGAATNVPQQGRSDRWRTMSGGYIPYRREYGVVGQPDRGNVRGHAGREEH